MYVCWLLMEHDFDCCPVKPPSVRGVWCVSVAEPLALATDGTYLLWPDGANYSARRLAVAHARIPMAWHNGSDQQHRDCRTAGLCEPHSPDSSRTGRHINAGLMLDYVNRTAPVQAALENPFAAPCLGGSRAPMERC